MQLTRIQQNLRLSRYGGSPAKDGVQFAEMRRRYIFLIGGIALLDCVAGMYHAYERFIDQFPYWMMADQWYDELLSAILCGVILIACVAHYFRKAREMPAANHKRDLWRDRRELRWVLHAFAIFLALKFLIAFPKDLQALHNNPTPWKQTFISLFPFDTVFGVLLGAAVIFYDRWRLRRDAREQTEYCRVCGYDLRATPDRCPECGTIPSKKEIAL